MVSNRRTPIHTTAGRGAIGPKTHPPMRMQIRPTRAIGLLATLTIVLIAVSVTFLLWDMRKRELEAARLDTIGFTHMIREETEHTFDRVDLVLRGVQERMQTAYGSRLALDSGAVRLLLSARIFGIRQLGALFLLDARRHRRQFVARRRRAGRAATPTRNTSRRSPAAGRRACSSAGRCATWPMAAGRCTSRARSPGTDGKFRGVAVAAMNILAAGAGVPDDEGRPPAADGAVPGRRHAGGQPAAPREPDRRIRARAGQRPAARARATRCAWSTMPPATAGAQAFALGRTGRFPLLVGVPNDEELALATWRENSIVDRRSARSWSAPSSSRPRGCWCAASTGRPNSRGRCATPTTATTRRSIRSWTRSWRWTSRTTSCCSTRRPSACSAWPRAR